MVDTTKAGCDRCRVLEAALTQKTLELSQEQESFEEYRESSAELETELEHELQQLEVRSAQAAQRASAAEQELENMRSRMTELQHRCASAESKEDSWKSECLQLRAQKQQLEQQQDDLSTSVRVLEATEATLTHRVECEMEERFFLHSELEEVKSANEVSMERMRAQMVELEEELAALKASADEVPSIHEKEVALSNALRSPTLCVLPDHDALVNVNIKQVDSGLWGMGLHPRKRLRTANS